MIPIGELEIGRRLWRNVYGYTFKDRRGLACFNPSALYKSGENHFIKVSLEPFQNDDYYVAVKVDGSKT